LLPMVLEMRRRGIRIDQAAAEHARDLILQKRDAALTELSGHLGTCIGMDEIAGRKWLTQTFDAHKIKYPRTEKGNPSFTAGKSGWMATHQHWLPQLIARANKYDAAGSKFLEAHILGHIVNGRIHSEIHPHRSADGSGTCSFRFSYSDPPLQQMPVRDKELGPLIRSVFLAEQGEIWAKPDISQQEFRLVVPYAVLRKLPGALQAAEFYRNDPDADFHAIAAQLTGLVREDAKAVNFAIIYGVGIKKFAAMIKKTVSEAQAIRAQYEHKLPFLFRLDVLCKSEAKRLGITELYDGAKRHWNYYAPRYVFAKGAGPCPREEAQRRRKDPSHPWHGAWLVRHKTHTALNALIQGSAARHTKLWMLACWREGIIPLLQMHDALDCSVATREQGELVARLGCEAVRLEVPVRVDLKFGRSWGDATHGWEDVPTTTAEPPTRINGADNHTIETATIELPQASTAAPPTPDIPAPTVPLAALIDEPIGRNRLILCRFHAERTPSLKIYDDHFYCFGCNTYGDQVDWLMRVEGLEREEAIHIIETWDGPLVVPAQEDASEKRAYALRWWKNARPITGTLAEQYLARTRGIDLEMLPADIGEVLRFHPRCPFGPGTRLPCLLALMRDVATNEPVGIQRIALTPDAGKIGRRSLGSMGVVKFWPAGFQLVVGEGIETVLAAATRISHHDAALQPAWSAVTADNLEDFPVVPGVERLIILADNDVNGVGQAAAEICKQRWAQEGRTGEVLLPEHPDTDFNDIILRTMERAP
jgi:DNA polymerase I-like protein with 3'-5' exonuclease and polymerase domains